ncbi:hypothetical protein [Undibacterium sp. FT79W]|uniref:hypothetical protein n=1 Tax=Undibacterium sp. FT79W TaxID=2762296 RepID=UPI002103EF96|nr:hypothetical protein [Undibacterium sp. FT79W]
MKTSILTSVVIGLIAFSSVTWADDKMACDTGKGSYVTGKVTSGPKFKSGKFLKGVELSHTHLKVKVDESGDIYDVAIDNVFANGYVKNSKKIPPSLKQIAVGDSVELCGQEYTDGTKGIHWVHTDCGKTPSPNKPNGFIKIVKQDGSVSDNLESLETYCPLWN